MKKKKHTIILRILMQIIESYLHSNKKIQKLNEITNLLKIFLIYLLAIHKKKKNLVGI
jgi:hypothetical protein